jgi:hypothetical protein
LFSPIPGNLLAVGRKMISHRIDLGLSSATIPASSADGLSSYARVCRHRFNALAAATIGHVRPHAILAHPVLTDPSPRLRARGVDHEAMRWGRLFVALTCLSNVKEHGPKYLSCLGKLLKVFGKRLAVSIALLLTVQNKDLAYASLF